MPTVFAFWPFYNPLGNKHDFKYNNKYNNVSANSLCFKYHSLDTIILTVLATSKTQEQLE